MPPQFDRVQVGCGADTEYPDQLVLTSIEAALARVSLHPRDQIEHCPVRAPAGGNQLLDMAPIHTDKVNGAIDRGFGCGAYRFLQKSDERITRHLAGCHGKL